MHSAPVVCLPDVESARRRLAGGLRVTPCSDATALSDAAGIRIVLKREDLQRTGSFKERGARNALLALSREQRSRGVVAASAGNHALGLAFHGAQLGVNVTVVVPLSAPEVKVARCRALGATVVAHGSTFEEANRHALDLAGVTGATVIHPFDDTAVIAGQGTIGLEILEQTPGVDTIVVPVGGGGLLAGIVAAVKEARPDVRIVAVEPGNAAGFLAAHLCGHPTRAALAPTLADGLAVSVVGETTFRIAAWRVDDLVTVTESEIAQAISALARSCGCIAEGAGAAALAAVLAGKVNGRTIAVPVTGRNIDLCVHRQVLASASGTAVRTPCLRGLAA